MQKTLKKIVSLSLALLMCLSLFSFSVPALAMTIPAVELKFNFGRSDTAVYEDWTNVLVSGTGNVQNGEPLLPYTEEQSWGIIPREQRFQSRTRTGGANVMENTWIGGNGVDGNAPWQFRADVPNGTYDITVYAVDMNSGSTNNITIDINGTQVLSKAKAYSAGMVPEDFTVEVTGGTLLFTFSGNQGYVNGIHIKSVEPEEPTPTVQRPVEYLDRGLVAAKTNEGVYLSWRFLGDEPDGISWNVYRDGEKIATIDPRDVDPESDYETNPGVVKENTTPSNYTDADGTLESVYEVAPVINGDEGELQGMSVPMLTTILSGSGEQRGSTKMVPVKTAPSSVPLPTWSYRGYRTGNISAANMTIADTGGQHWYVVDMDLLRAFREPYENGTAVTQSDLDGWVAQLNTYNTTANALGVKTYDSSAWATVNPLGSDGIISEALYNELEAEFIKYVENLDCGANLPFYMNGSAVYTTNSSNYSMRNMSVGDFDGDGEYEIAVQWRSSSPDPMYSEPIYSGGSIVNAPEYYDVYKLDGTLLFRVDTGYNYTSGNDHESPILVGDFDGDGRSELMLKTGLGARIGYWNGTTVVYDDTPDTVVGGELGLNATTDAFKEYFTAGNTEALNKYWGVLNSFTISYRSPTSGGGNDGPNDPAVKRWIKTYHLGRMGASTDDNEYMSAFKWDAETGKGVLLESAKYPFPYRGAEDGTNWAMTPCSQRGNYSYLAHPSSAIGSSSSDYKAQIMQEKEGYWLENPWKAAMWGDAQGNRANRYLGVVACLDGENWYAVSERGYYERTTFSAFRIEDGKVVLKAAFDSKDSQYWSLGGSAYDYQNRGNHAVWSGDIDKDGKDEIVMKAMSLKLNDTGDKILPFILYGDVMPSIETQPTQPTAGTYLFATDEIRNNPDNIWAPLRHGDRGILIAIDKDDNYAVWSGNEEHILDDLRTGYNYGWLPGPEAHNVLEGRKLDAQGNVVETNSLIYSVYSGGDDEGSVAGNFSNRWPGAQGGVASGSTGVRSLVTGEVVGASTTARGIAQGQYAIWFGGGLTHMAVNGATINSINDNTFAATSWLATGYTNNSQKSTPMLKADMYGDWREELLYVSGSNIAVVTTLIPTEYGIRTLMHDPMYRQGVANKNCGYDQFTTAGFYLGDEAELPRQRDDIYINKYEAPEIPDVPTAPEMPENVLYTPVTEDSVTINWDAVEGADGYNIYRRDSKTATAELLATIDSLGYVDFDVEQGTDYWYSVSAYNASGESERTKEAFIMPANDDAVLLTSFTAKVKGSRLRLGDLDGDGRTDILVCHTTSQSNYTYMASVLYVLIAYNLEGDILWEYSLDPSYDPDNPNSGVTGSSADEPVNIQDVNGDGCNEVVALMHPSKNRGTNFYGASVVVLDGKTGLPLKDASGNDCIKPMKELSIPGMSNDDLITTSYSASANRENVNDLGDCFAFGNFDGRAIDNQFIVLKSRYCNATILEMFDRDGNFAMNYVFRQPQTQTWGSNRTAAGHMPLVVDLDGDGIDELVSNYTVMKVETDENGNAVRHDADSANGNLGQPKVYYWWWINRNVVNRSGAEDMPDSYKNDTTVVTYPGTTTQIGATDHCDTIQVGYVLGEDGPLCVIFGGGGPDGASSSLTATATFCYTWDGVFQWAAVGSAYEPQSLNLAQFRTDHDGLMTYGLDRRTRGAASNTGWGKDSMFVIASDGSMAQLEYPLSTDYGNPMGWSTIVIRVDNWTGTYAPLCLSFNRNGESRAAARSYGYPAGENIGTDYRETRKALWMEDYREPALYDGYFNTLFKMGVPTEDRDYMFENNVDWRYMAMDLCGDARTELVAYDDSGRINIYYNNSNGDVRSNEDGTLNEDDVLDVLRSGITGEPKQQTYFMANYSRYPTDSYFDDMRTRTPAQPHAENVTETSAYIDWTPIINATGYTLYKNGEKVGDFTAIGWQDDDIVPGVEYSYTVTATGVKGVSKVSLPLVLGTTESGSILSLEVDSRIQKLVNGYAANIPVEVTANNPDGLKIYAGLFVDGVMFMQTEVVDGKAVIRMPAFTTNNENVYVKAWFEGSEPEIQTAIAVAQPAGLWEPSVTEIDGRLYVTFASAITFSGTVTVRGTAALAVSLSADRKTLEISGFESPVAGGDKIVITKVKYPDLFPSYSFTFTLTA